jgi:predicted MFS family arabinose efflux permease
LYVKIGLDGSDGLYAALSAVSGVGALVGGLMLARRTMIDVAFLGWMTLVYAAALGLLACSPDAWWALVPLALVGLGQLGVLASASTVVQVQSVPSMRGRVLALFTLATVGANPVGGAVAGWTADRFGAAFTVAYGALFTFVLGFATLWAAYRARTPATR